MLGEVSGPSGDGTSGFVASHELSSPPTFLRRARVLTGRNSRMEIRLGLHQIEWPERKFQKNVGEVESTLDKTFEREWPLLRFREKDNSRGSQQSLITRHRIENPRAVNEEQNR